MYFQTVTQIMLYIVYTPKSWAPGNPLTRRLLKSPGCQTVDKRIRSRHFDVRVAGSSLPTVDSPLCSHLMAIGSLPGK